MALIVRVINHIDDTLVADTPVFSANVSYGLNRSGEFDIDLPRNVPAVEGIVEGDYCEIYDSGKLLLRGIVQEVEQKYDEKTSLSLRGRDVMDNIYYIGSSPFAVAHNRAVLAVLAETLKWANWRIGELDTLNNPTAVTSIDVRNEDRLILQVQKILEALQKANYRYGGFQAGYHTLDIGSFGKSSGIAIYTPPDDTRIINKASGIGWMKSFTVKTVLSDITQAVSLIGGDITDDQSRQRSVWMGDGLTSNADRDAYFADPDFGFLEIVPYKKAVIWNRALGNDLGIREFGSFFLDGIISASLGGSELGKIDTTVASRRTQSYTFYSTPGYLREFIFRIRGHVGTPSDVTAYVYESSGFAPGVVGTLDTLLYSYVIPAAQLGDATIVRVPIPAETVRIEEGQQYTVVLIPTYVNSSYYTITVNASWPPTPAQYLFNNQLDAALTALGAGSTGTTRLPMCEFIIDPDGDPVGLWYNARADQFTAQDETLSGTVALNAIQAAGKGLIEFAKGLLQERNEASVEYDLGDVYGEDILPNIGETVFVSGRAQAFYLNPLTGEAHVVNLQVEEDLRIDEIKINLGNDKTSYQFKVSTQTGVVPQDESIILLDRSKHQANKVSSTGFRDLFVRSIVLETQTISALSPNAINDNGLAVLEIELNYTAAPAGAILAVQAGVPFGSSPNGDLKVEWVSELDVDSAAGPVVRLSIGKREWRYTDEATINYYVAWR